MTRRAARRAAAPLRRTALAALLVALAPHAAAAQDVRIRDLTLQEQTVPVRLMGYGIVVGLDGSGDRTSGGVRGGGGPTVQSVANLLRRFDVEVPAEMLRTRNVAAVLVTAEVSPYLRSGGRFDLHVSSLGDARSLRGGVLWMTPLVADAGAQPVATAQGPLLVGDGGGPRGGYPVETTARIPDGGILEQEMPRPAFASSSQRLILREPDLTTAVRIADAVNAALGGGSAAVEDPGSVRLTLGQGDAPVLLARIGDLRVQPDRPARLVIDGREGTIVAGGDLGVGAATVSHGALTLTIGGGAGDGLGHIGVPVGTPVQEVAAALHAVQTPPQVVAAIFESLRAAGALAAEVVIR